MENPAVNLSNIQKIVPAENHSLDDIDNVLIGDVQVKSPGDALNIQQNNLNETERINLTDQYLNLTKEVEGFKEMKIG